MPDPQERHSIGTGTASSDQLLGRPGPAPVIRSRFSLEPSVKVGQAWVSVTARRRVSCVPLARTRSALSGPCNGDHAGANGKQPPARPSILLPPRLTAAEIKRKRRERRFDSNTKQIILPGMEQNKSDRSLTAIIPSCRAPKDDKRDRILL
ncbi:Persephin [Manis pentadactyla]|nr:Persephin [Manis pentadactyla]